MFAPKGLFSSLLCPESSPCTRDPCLFCHKPASELRRPTPLTSSLLEFKPVAAPLSGVRSNQQTIPNTGTVQNAVKPDIVNAISRKRPADEVSGPSASKAVIEPPKKLKRVETSYPTTSSGVPKITANPAKSHVPINQRQTMLTTLYETFRRLYSPIISSSPSLPGQHAIAQEEEVYAKTNKTTYRNAIISAVASIQKRPPPDSKFHPSVGTIAECTVRRERLSSTTSTELLASHLSSLLLSTRDMEAMGYIVDIPPVTGGDKPNEVGNMTTCDRCKSTFVVEKSPSMTECNYHWGRPYTRKVDGARDTTYKCCGGLPGSRGCEQGPHVFNEKNEEILHSRYPFVTFSETETTENSDDGALEVCSIDCEMIYTTAGMSCARVSMIDGRGDQVFDELVRMSENVQVLDLNTRFSGITSLDSAIYDLDHIRVALRSYIGSNTIIIGHGLENDLKALRLVHHRVVDTSALYKHNLGLPYRRSLRELARVYLDRTIQSGDGVTGHSSLEDARATLDLVKHWVAENNLNKSQK